MQNIKHIFFDLDHTLWDFDKNSELAFKQIFEERKINLNFKKFMAYYYPINLNYWKLYRDEKISKAVLRYKRLQETFNELNYEASDSLINKVADDYLAYLPNYNFLIEGTTELLEYLYPKYKLHIITNGFKDTQSRKMEKANIEKYFNVIVTSESVGVKKPNSQIFEFALKQAEAKPTESVMIGDSYEADITGAFNAGMLPIHFDMEQKKGNNAVATVNSLLAIKQYL